METREIVRRAIEFASPPRLPFWQHDLPRVPDDVCDVWELDRARAAWFFRSGNEDRLHAALDYLTPASINAAAWAAPRRHGGGPNQRDVARK